MITATRGAKRGAMAGLLTAVAIAAGTSIIYQRCAGPITLNAEFSSATAIYPGDEVRVAGVKVGTIAAIEPAGDHASITMHVDRDTPIPADAKAILVAQSLIAARYVQLTPAYEDSGPTLPDRATIPLDRTAVPVEWDEVKDQLTRLATELGPSGNQQSTSLSRFLDSTAHALDGGTANKLRQALNQLSGVGRILASGSGNLVDVIKNLQTFITTLRDSNQQIVQFEDRLATLSSVLDGSKSDLDAALRNVSDVVGSVERFVKGSRNQTAEQLARLTDVTQNIVDHQKDLEQILHVAPTALANSLNIFDPRTGSAGGVFTFKNFSNPKYFFCDMIAAYETAVSVKTSKLCELFLGAGLGSLNFNDLPFPINPVLNATPRPSDFIYSDPKLAPGAPKIPDPPEPPPAVSAYSGLPGDTADPAANPSPGHGLPDLLLPPPAAAAGPPPPPQPERPPGS
jgi:phospholipid/cholesterol/gamma-HCH transport system substrate-binding protein